MPALAVCVSDFFAAGAARVVSSIAAVLCMPAWQFLVVVNILLLITGIFMEPTGLFLILAPILFPIATRRCIDPVHLGLTRW